MGKLAAVATAIVVLTTACCLAAKVNVGDAAPKWSGIIGVDDKEHGLADYKDAKLIVLVFTCNHCPIAQAYEDRLVQFQKDYKAKAVQVVAVNVNNIEPDRLEPMKKRAKEKEFNFPYLYDKTQKIGRDHDAICTPHVYVLDQERKIAYMGQIDDNDRADKVTKRPLRDAVDALLAGKKPPEPATKPFGCSIKYE
jgi:peroxiredoxin